MPVYRQEGQTLRTPRLPRLGIIRLGTKEVRKRADGSEYTFPRASEHFVLDDAPQIAEIYGDKPTVIEPVFLPVDDENIVASHWLRMYTATWGLTCKGDGMAANRLVDQEKLDTTGEPVPASRDTKKPAMMQVNCPCPLLESGQCREVLFLSLLLPDVPGVGIWQVGTGSANSISNIQGSLAMIRAIAGRISGIPLKLSLIPMTVTSVARGGRVTIRVLQFDLAQSITPMQLASSARSRQLGILPPPPDESTEMPADTEPLIVEAMGDPTEAPVAEFTNKRDIQQERPVAPPAYVPPQPTVQQPRNTEAQTPASKYCPAHPDKMLGRTSSGAMGHPIGNGEFCYGVMVPPQIPTAFAAPPPSVVVSEQPLPKPSMITVTETDVVEELQQAAAPTTSPISRKRPAAAKVPEDDNRILVIKEAAQRLGFSDFETGIILGGDINKYLNSGKTAVMAVQEMEEFAQRRKVNAGKVVQPSDTTKREEVTLYEENV